MQYIKDTTCKIKTLKSSLDMKGAKKKFQVNLIGNSYYQYILWNFMVSKNLKIIFKISQVKYLL